MIKLRMKRVQGTFELKATSSFGVENLEAAGRFFAGDCQVDYATIHEFNTQINGQLVCLLTNAKDVEFLHAALCNPAKCRNQK